MQFGPWGRGQLCFTIGRYEANKQFSNFLNMKTDPPKRRDISAQQHSDFGQKGNAITYKPHS
jgi:hypothetical protein